VITLGQPQSDNNNRRFLVIFSGQVKCAQIKQLSTLKMKLGIQNGGRYRQVVAIRRCLLTQVWLYTYILALLLEVGRRKAQARREQLTLK